MIKLSKCTTANSVANIAPRIISYLLSAALAVCFLCVSHSNTGVAYFGVAILEFAILILLSPILIGAEPPLSGSGCNSVCLSIWVHGLLYHKCIASPISTMSMQRLTVK